MLSITRIITGATTLWVLAAGSDELVETSLGSVEGRERISRDGRSYTAWTKIPFAQPPVGSLRFAPPVPNDKWEGILKATENHPMCSQAKFHAGKDVEGQEDCLYLSVYRPKTEIKNLPVLFYVHGGAFIFGHPGVPEMADFLMDEDVILVTTTYRLGPLGFASLNDQELPGNLGLKDQALALHWVHDHIAAFGGNPQAITVFGESAGAASVQYLALSPATRDLVKGVVATSGVVNKIWSRIDPRFLKEMTKNLAAQLNCTRETSGEIVECLRTIEDPFKIIVAAELVKLKDDLVDIPFGPTIEPAGPGAFATEDFTEAESTKPMIISFAAGEHLLFELFIKMRGGGTVKNASRDLDAYSRNLLKRFFKDDDKLVAAAARVKERYLKHDKDSIPELIHDVSMVRQDKNFIYPAMSVAENHKGPLWMYQFVHRGEFSLIDLIIQVNTTVAAHADETLYFFNQRSKFNIVTDDPLPNDIRVSKELVRFLANFATNSTPTSEGSPIWKPYKDGGILQVKTEGSEMAEKAFVQEQLDTMTFWREIFDSASYSNKDEL